MIKLQIFGGELALAQKFAFLERAFFVFPLVEFIVYIYLWWMGLLWQNKARPKLSSAWYTITL